MEEEEFVSLTQKLEKIKKDYESNYKTLISDADTITRQLKTLIDQTQKSIEEVASARKQAYSALYAVRTETIIAQVHFCPICSYPLTIKQRLPYKISVLSRSYLCPHCNTAFSIVLHKDKSWKEKVPAT